MLILICKDSATQVPREVESLEDAQAIASQGFEVLIQGEDGRKVPLSEAMKPNTGTPVGVGDSAYADPYRLDTPADAKPAGLVAKVKAAVTRKKKA